jgi:hypothetical protein
MNEEAEGMIRLCDDCEMFFSRFFPVALVAWNIRSRILLNIVRGNRTGLICLGRVEPTLLESYWLCWDPGGDDRDTRTIASIRSTGNDELRLVVLRLGSSTHSAGRREDSCVIKPPKTRDQIVESSRQYR